MKNKDRPSAVLAFQKVSMEVNESQKDGYRSTDPRPPDPDTVVCKAAIKVKYEKQKKNRTAY